MATRRRSPTRRRTTRRRRQTTPFVVSGRFLREALALVLLFLAIISVIALFAPNNPYYPVVFPLFWGAVVVFVLAMARHLRVFAAVRAEGPNPFADIPRRFVGHERSAPAAAPAGTPAAVIERLNKEIARIMAIPEVKQKFHFLPRDVDQLCRVRQFRTSRQVTVFCDLVHRYQVLAMRLFCIATRYH